MSQPLLSLCMIVRDSSRTLAACLQSIRPWVDEIVVVDTGSVDNSRDIARNFGAQIHEFPWIDDFSAARNESLDHATGKWLLWMDADDTIDADNGRKLRELVTGPHADNLLAYVVQVHCPSPSTDGGDQTTVVDHVKLIRNRPQIRFEGRIHEQLLSSIRRLQGEVAWTDLFVVHSGVDHAPEAKQRKIDRDLRILQLDLAERPNHPFVMFNLGMTFNDEGDHGQAIHWLLRSLAVSQPGESHIRKAYALLVASLTAIGQLEEAHKRCNQGLDLFPQDAELRFRQGILFHQVGRLEDSVQSYQRVLREQEPRHFTSIDPSIRGYKARHNLALVYTDQGHHQLAELQWRSILGAVPTYRPGWSSLGSTLIKQGKFSALTEVVEELRQQPELDFECRLLEIESAIARRDFETASQCLQQMPPAAHDDTRLLRLRCHYLFECGTLEEAESAQLRLLSLDPNCPMALHNLGLIYLRQDRLAESADALRRSLLFRPNAVYTRDQLKLVEQALNARPGGHLAAATAPPECVAHSHAIRPLSSVVGEAGLGNGELAQYSAVPSQSCADIAGRTNRHKQHRFEWVSLAKLAEATRELAAQLPGNVAGIVGVPRSGMIPASILAALLQLPLCEFAEDGSIRPMHHGGRGSSLGWAGSAEGPLVVVDDTVYGGGSMARVRQLTLPQKQGLIYTAVFARPEAAAVVDLYGRLLPSPHLLEWNFFNSAVLVGVSIDPVLSGGVALDLDGILCHDPTVCDADDGPALDEYVKWLECATPRWLPRRLPVKCIITARLERWRAETEQWLSRHGVAWERLVMHPAERMSVRNASDIAAWKAQALLESGCRWFMESDHRQAERIQQLCGLPVICPDAEHVFQ